MKVTLAKPPHLHLSPDGRGRQRPVRVPQVIQVLKALHARVLGQRGDGVPWLGNVRDAECAGAAEDDDVEEGVRAETVRAMDGRRRALAGSEEAGDNLRSNGVRATRGKRQRGVNSRATF